MCSFQLHTYTVHGKCKIIQIQLHGLLTLLFIHASIPATNRWLIVVTQWWHFLVSRRHWKQHNDKKLNISTDVRNPHFYRIKVTNILMRFYRDVTNSVVPLSCLQALCLLYFWMWESRHTRPLGLPNLICAEQCWGENEHWNLPSSKRSLFFSDAPFCLYAAPSCCRLLWLHLHRVDKIIETPYDAKSRLESHAWWINSFHVT